MIDHSALVTRIAELETQLIHLQQAHQMREQENLRLRTRLVDMSHLYDDADLAPKRPRTDSDTLTESTFTRRARAVFGSLFATSQPIHNEQAYSLTKVKDSFIGVLEASTILFSGDWRAAQHIAKAEAQSDTHYLSVLADQHFFVPPILVKKIAAGGTMFAKSLGMCLSLDEFSRDWSLLHFAPASNKSERDRLLQQQGIEQADLLVDQHTYHLSKKDTKMVIQGSFDGSIDAILGTVANFIVFAKSVVPVPEWGASPNNPAMINWLITLTDILGTNLSAKHRLADLCSRHDHLLFSIFSCFQDIFGAFGKIMLETDLVKTADSVIQGATSLQLPPSYNKIFDYPYETFLRSRTRLTNLVKDQLLGDFIGPLGSYRVVHPLPPSAPPSAKQTTKVEDNTKPSMQAGQRRGRLPSSASSTIAPNTHSVPGIGDWLLSTNGSLKDFRIPPGVPNFCMRFAFRGRTCTNSHCQYRHMGKDQFTPDEKQLLDTYISANAGKFQYAQ